MSLHPSGLQLPCNSYEKAVAREMSKDAVTSKLLSMQNRTVPCAAAHRPNPIFPLLPQSADVNYKRANQLGRAQIHLVLLLLSSPAGYGCTITTRTTVTVYTVTWYCRCR